MKKIITTLVLAILSLSLNLFAADGPDSMYVHFTGSNGDSIVVHAIADVDSIVYYASEVLPTTSGTFTDSRDSKVYKWVTIGTQTWMAENLAFLPAVHSNDEFKTFTGVTAQDSIRYGVYDYDGSIVADAKASANYTTYGVLYNWYAAMSGANSSDDSPSGIQGACPAGWHLPSDAEWNSLKDYLSTSHSSTEGTALKSTTGWYSDGNGTDDYDFAGLPGGSRDNSTGTFGSVGKSGYWWGSTQASNSDVYSRRLAFYGSAVLRNPNNKSFGYSVRCVKD